MSPRRLLPLAVASSLVLVVLMAAGILSFPTADALPPGGQDVFNVTAQVDVTSRLGQEVVSLEGTASLEREDPHMEGDVEVADLELTSLQLQGTSLIGNVVVSESPTLVSPGELRSLQPDAQFPASSFIDAYVSVNIPANPSPTLTLHNNTAFHLVPTGGDAEVPVTAWPPIGVTYALEPIFGFDNDGDTLIDEDTPDDDGDGLIDEDRAGPDPDTPGSGYECGDNADCDDDEGEDPPADLCPPASQGSPTLCDQDGDGLIDEDPACIPLLNPGNTHLKHGICVRDVSITIGAAKTPTPTPPVPASTGQTLSVAPGGPSGLHPAALLEFSTGAPTGPVQVTGNDNFANSYPILGVPFTGLQNTSTFSVEETEPLSLPSCVVVPPNEKGRTAWYRYTPSSGGVISVDTEGSGFDTVIGVYTGAALNALGIVGCDDDSGTGLLSALMFPATAGTTYYIQAGGFNADFGDLVLNVSGPGGAGAGAAAPTVRISCQALGLSADGCDLGQDGDQDDLDALSFGAEFQPEDYAYAFSVAPGGLGLAASGVSGQAGCSPAQPQADEFSTALNGSNALLFDGDGAGPSCPFANPIGLLELPQSDDLDAMEPHPPGFVDANNDGALDGSVFFSLATGSPSLVTLGRNAADIMWAHGGAPGLYVSANFLGLNFGDDIDALCIVDRGVPNVYEAGTDTVLFSLAAGSPALGDFGFSAADILSPGPQRQQAASLLGLRATDDLDALACYDFDAPPPPTPTVTPTPAGLAGDANCSGSVNSIDAAVVLQRTAGLVNSVPCPTLADVNGDGQINSLDAALILQYVAGLLDQLPP